MNGRSLISTLVLLAAAGQAWAGSHLDSMPPSMKWYLEQMAKKDWFVPRKDLPDSQGLRPVGKWGRGPANRVTGRDSLVFMSMGSEVAVFSALDKNHIRILSEIQCHEMTGRLCIRDSFLFVGCNGPVEVYNIANPARPTFVNRVSAAAGAEIALQDTLAFVLGVDSLMIFNISSPQDFRFVGGCRDSGYNMCVANGFAYLCDRWGLYVIDATDPTRPHRATTLTTAQTGAVTVDSGYCYYTTMSASPAALVIADVSDPYHPSQVGSRSNIGGYDIYKLGMFVYLPGFQIADVSIPSDPTVVGSLGYGGNGLWTRSPFSYSFLAAGSDGIAMVNITDPVNPALDTVVGGADVSYDVSVSGGLACVANFFSGLKVLTTVDPTAPLQIGSYDSVGNSPEAQGVAVRDSLAFLLAGVWSPTAFRVIDLSSPSNPSLLATAGVFNPGEAVALRDSLAYVAEDYKLEIFSVADPRNPRLVGSCGLPNSSFGLFVRDSLAYVANLTSVQVISVARPAAPSVVGSCNVSALGVFVSDTVAFVAGYDAGFYALSVADPRAPRVISNLYFPEFCEDVTVQGSLAYLGANRLHVVDVGDPSRMHEVGYYDTPNHVRRVFRLDSCIYAACYGAGVCIFETTNLSGLAERGPAEEQPVAANLFPNPARNRLRLTVGGGSNPVSCIKIRNVSGRVVLILPDCSKTRKEVVSREINISSLPEGCYFIDLVPSSRANGLKFVKLR